MITLINDPSHVLDIQGGSKKSKLLSQYNSLLFLSHPVISYPFAAYISYQNFLPFPYADFNDIRHIA